MRRGLTIKRRTGLLCSALIVAAVAAMPLLLQQSPRARADAINATDFVITIDTTKTQNGSGTDREFKIPIVGGTRPYNYTVDCNNDGVLEATGQTGNYTCSYAAPGIYKVRIGGEFPRFRFNIAKEELKLVSVDQWGTMQWERLSDGFRGAKNMDLLATDVPDLTRATSLNGLFFDAESLKGEGANWNWNTATITDMGSVFGGAKLFNQPLPWNTSNVTTMSFIFGRASAFNQPLNHWDVSKVQNGLAMFQLATSFNQPLNNWQTGAMTDVGSMFQNARAFNQPLDSWNMSNVTNMANMFQSARAFNQPLNSWQVGKVTNMADMFQGADSFNQPLDSWDVSKVTNMSEMFSQAAAFKQSLAAWDVSRVTAATDMLDNTKLSVASYDATLIAWNARPLQKNVAFGARSLKYCAATAARANMTSPTGYEWTISGDTRQCPTFTLTFDTQQGTPVPPAQQIEQGALALKPSDPSRPGFRFGGWYTGLDYAEEWDFAVNTMPAQATTLYARWIDAQAPAAPAAAPDLVDSDDSGDSNTDNVTNLRRPSFTLHCSEAGSRVLLYVDGTHVGETICPTIGDVTAAPTVDLNEGARAISYIEADATGNESPHSPSLTITVDATPPTPVITLDNIAGDNVINNTEAGNPQVVSGTVTGGRQGDPITVTVNGVSHNAQLGADGSFRVVVPGSDLVNNASLQVIAKVVAYDVAGNSREAQTVRAYTLETGTIPAPATPVLPASSDSGSNNSDGITNDATPAVTLQCPAAGSKLYLFVDSHQIQTLNCASTDPIEVVLPALGDGVHTVAYRYETPAGNLSAGSSSLSITVDTGAPIGAAVDTVAATPSPELSGTVDDAGAQIMITIEGRQFAARNNGDGTWTLPHGVLVPALAVGIHPFEASFTDIAGNVSTVRAVLTIKAAPTGTEQPAAPATPNAPQRLSDTGGNLWTAVLAVLGCLVGGSVLLVRAKRA